MNYSKMLLERIRILNRELVRYAEPATAEESARRDALLQALAWYVHKLQMRLLPTPRTASVGPDANGSWSRDPSPRLGRSSHAGAR